MIEESSLDRLIECVWSALERESEECNVYCQERCVESVTRLLGADHYYVRRLHILGRRWDPKQALATLGLLAATRQELTKRIERGVIDSEHLS
ncbi:MAG: hypothetical protein AB1733_07750 [Thermodesulfobacteriota bacterium]